MISRARSQARGCRLSHDVSGKSSSLHKRAIEMCNSWDVPVRSKRKARERMPEIYMERHALSAATGMGRAPRTGNEGCNGVVRTTRCRIYDAANEILTMCVQHKISYKYLLPEHRFVAGFFLFSTLHRCVDKDILSIESISR